MYVTVSLCLCALIDSSLCYYATVFEQEKHPDALQPLLPEIHAFAAHNHYNVLIPILQYVRFSSAGMLG